MQEDDSGEDRELLQLYQTVVRYIFSQFICLTKAHALQLEEFSPDLLQHQPFLFIDTYLTMERHLKMLLKKVSQNFIVQEAFRSLVSLEYIISDELLEKHQYVSDGLLLKMLD